MPVGGGDAAAAPACRHAGHRLPATHSGIKPLHARLVVGGIEAAQTVDAIFQHSQSAVPSPCAHRRTGAPDACERIIALHTAQAGGAIVTATNVDQGIVGADAQTATFRSHWGDVAPLVGQRIVALRRGQITDSIVAADHIQLLVQGCYSGSRSSPQHWCHWTPRVRARIVHLALVVNGEETASSHRKYVGFHALRTTLLGSLAAHYAALLRKQMVLHGFQQQLLALGVIAHEGLRFHAAHEEIPAHQRQSDV